MQPLIGYPNMSLQTPFYNVNRVQPVSYNPYTMLQFQRQQQYLSQQQQYLSQQQRLYSQSLCPTTFSTISVLKHPATSLNINAIVEKALQIAVNAALMEGSQFTSNENNSKSQTELNTKDATLTPCKPSASKKIAKNKKITCPHTDRDHFAKGLCKSCYLKVGRTKKPSACSHDHLYAKGLCQKCYMVKYRLHQKKSSLVEEQSHESSDISSNGTLSSQIKHETDN